MIIHSRGAWCFTITVEGDYIMSSISIQSIYGKEVTFLYSKSDDLLHHNLDNSYLNSSGDLINIEEMLLNNV